MYNCRQFPREHFFLNVKFSTICKMSPQSLENHVYKGLLHIIIDLELFKMNLFFYSSCVNALKYLCYIQVGYNFRRIILSLFLYFLNIIFIIYKNQRKNCSITYKISVTLTSAVLLFLERIIEACCWTVAESECSNSTYYIASYFTGAT